MMNVALSLARLEFKTSFSFFWCELNNNQLVGDKECALYILYTKLTCEMIKEKDNCEKVF